METPDPRSALSPWISAHYRLGFSTLGCPHATLDQAIALCLRHRLDFLELRALEGRLDLPTFLPPADVRAALDRSGLTLPVVGSSLSLTAYDPAALKEFWTFCAWSSAAGARHIRLFGGGEWPHQPTREGLARATDLLAEFTRRKNTEGWTCDLALETHDSLSSARACVAVFDAIGQSLPVIWDTHHTWKIGGESPAESFALFGPQTVHLHVKDSAPSAESKSGYAYALPGTGTFPMAALEAVLQDTPQRPTLSLEWEKLWHPQLPPLEDALTNWSPRNS